MCRFAVFAVAVALATLVVGAPTSLAVLTAGRTSAATFATGTLAAPTSLTGTNGATAGLAWTASTSTSASGYLVLRSATSGSGYAQVGTITPVAATSTTDSPGNGTWYYVLQTYLQGWTSASSNQAAVVVNDGITGYRDCTTTAADKTGAGDNNGYQTSPANACGAPDALVAKDTNSGTNTTVACINSGKDRHRFWGYPFGMPATVASVIGIQVQVSIGLNNTSGTTLLCAQLSWDGGTTWTSAKSVALTNAAITTLTLGAASDTWGHAWTAAQLSTTRFRVRLIDVSSLSTKEFQLDSVRVQVTYTP